jgi:hypothetical protein
VEPRKEEEEEDVKKNAYKYCNALSRNIVGYKVRAFDA